MPILPYVGEHKIIEITPCLNVSATTEKNINNNNKQKQKQAKMWLVGIYPQSKETTEHFYKAYKVALFSVCSAWGTKLFLILVMLANLPDGKRLKRLGGGGRGRLWRFGWSVGVDDCEGTERDTADFFCQMFCILDFWPITQFLVGYSFLLNNIEQ